ncbi:MAG: GNAT family N-acetyltransferase [Pyrinomonadaceae bacterium]
MKNQAIHTTLKTGANYRTTTIERAGASHLVWEMDDSDGHFQLLSELTAKQERQIKSFYGRLSEVSILQHPDWDDVVKINGKRLFFTFHKGTELVAYAIVRFPNKRIANVEFGPVATNPRSALAALRRIRIAVKEATNAWYLCVQLPWHTGSKTEYIEFRMDNEMTAKRFFDKRNWSSSVIDTHKSDQEIASAFSSNHRRSLKKATKAGLETREFFTDAEIAEFNRIYVDMYGTRGRKIDESSNLEEYLKIRNFFKRTGNGFFYGVFKDDKLLGGMIIIRQGEAGFYYHAATDPEWRSIPVQHLGVVAVLDELRSREIRFFDFGGYNHMVDENDQVYNINRFKDGFTKHYVFYPRLLYFEFVPNAVRLLDGIQACKDLIKKVIRRA